MIVCPGCELEDPEVKIIDTEQVKAAYPCSLDVVQGEVVEGINGPGEIVENLGHDRDDREIRCESCFHTTHVDDLSEWLKDTVICQSCSGNGFRRLVADRVIETCVDCHGAGQVDPE